jgi:C4-dicarboxylate-specific signal transduction histidine kinase
VTDDDSTALRRQLAALESRLQKSEDRRRALLHILVDMNESNQRLARQRKAMLHIMSDYENERRQLGQQSDKLRNARRALLHLLLDSHEANQQLREKQEQLVQAGKLATLGELTTGVAHELNNPLNNIGLFTGNVIDMVSVGRVERDSILRDLGRAMQQVGKATEIISHLRTFGRAAPSSREPLDINEVIERALSLLSEQLRLRDIDVELELASEPPIVRGNAIQLEQVCLNLLTNARDALGDSHMRVISISSAVADGTVRVAFSDTGAGIPPELEPRIFDPFFTTKEVGAGTGLGLSIIYGIIQDHAGTISVDNQPGSGVTFTIELPAFAAAAEDDAT